MSQIRRTALYLGILRLAVVSCSILMCQKGQYKAGDKCQACQTGSFNDHTDHQDTDCMPCTQANSLLHETLNTTCTSARDSLLGCKPKYYRKESKHGNGECNRCTSCEADGQFEAQECRAYSNTVCCPQKNMNFKNGQCVLYCGIGEFLNEASKQCQPCPEGSFMTEVQHTNIACRPCRDHYYYQYAHMTIRCNKTHPGEFECYQNYYKVPLKDEDFECYPCPICFNQSGNSYKIKPCDQVTNTLCCPQPDMVAQKTRSGLRCHYKSEPKTNERVPDVKEDRNSKTDRGHQPKTDVGHKTDKIQEKPATDFNGSSTNSVHGVSKLMCLLFVILIHF